MTVEVRMPKIGLSEEDMILESWLKKEGDPVKEGEPIAIIQGEKLTNEIEAEAEGTMGEIFIAEGELVKINTLLANIEVIVKN